MGLLFRAVLCTSSASGFMNFNKRKTNRACETTMLKNGAWRRPKRARRILTTMVLALWWREDSCW
jgi:hypothetical protein